MNKKSVTNFYIKEEGPFSFKIIRKIENVSIKELNEEQMYQKTLKEITNENFLISYEYQLNDILYDFEKMCYDKGVKILNNRSIKGFYTDFIDLFLNNIILEEFPYNTDSEDDDNYVDVYEQL